MRTLWVSAALLATATAFQSPSQHAGLTSRTAFRPPTELNGLFGPSKAEQEAEAARAPAPAIHSTPSTRRAVQG